MPEKEPWPDLLQRLSDLKYRIRRPGQKTVAGYELFLVDLSEWKLRFPDRTPLIWAKAEVAEYRPALELAESLQDVARQQGWRHRDCIVLLDGDGQELKAQTSVQYFPRFVVVDEIDQRKILGAHSFTGALLDFICEQVPITGLAPYEISGPVEGSRFFGRGREIDKILRQEGTNFAVLGIRKIGKTSLLREVRQRLLDQGEDPARILWLDCSTLSAPDQFVQEIVRGLNIRELTRLKQSYKYPFFFPDFLRRMYDTHGGRIIIFLDEADKFLMWVRNAPELLTSLRASVNAGHCRYIVAGFQDLLSKLYDQESPLYHKFEPLHLGPFELKETEEVVLRPMKSLRVRFENEGEIVARIHANTRGNPLLVQYYCMELINQLQLHNSRTLSPADVESIYASDGSKNLVVNTFRDNVSIQDRALVYVLLIYFPESKEMFTQEEMYGAMHEKGCPLSAEQIDQSCDRLVLAGVFVRDGLRYLFALPMFPRTLRTAYNLEFLLAATKKEMGS